NPGEPRISRIDTNLHESKHRRFAPRPPRGQERQEFKFKSETFSLGILGFLTRPGASPSLHESNTEDLRQERQEAKNAKNSNPNLKLSYLAFLASWRVSAQVRLFNS